MTITTLVVFLGTGIAIGMYVASQIEKHTEKQIKKKVEDYDKENR
jgi:uncharacterized protein YneF (UPF0154 family)|tara:strand:+ start:497 stop:631 length:135 start_codon:yes stop_codon:yes gene_type:complete